MCAHGIAKNWGEEAAWLKGFHPQHTVGAQPLSSRCSEPLEDWTGASLDCGPFLPESLARRCPQPPPIHTPSNHPASGLGFAQPGPDPPTHSIFPLMERTPEDDSPAASEAPA